MGLRRAGMDNVTMNGASVIGAAATMTQMETQTRYPILQEAAHSVGGWAVRNMATVGGNLFNQPPFGDFCVALLALDTKLKIQSADSERMVDLNEFMTNGRVTGGRRADRRITCPQSKRIDRFRKFGRRQANTATIVTVAAQINVVDRVVNGARIALGGAEQVAIRSYAAEAVLNNAPISQEIVAEAAAAAAKASNPITDAVASEWYRRQMIEVQLKQTLSEMLGV